MTELPPPVAFGLPAKFDKWRPDQSNAVMTQVDSKERFLLQVCPTGFGKSIVYMTSAQLTTGRTVILTSTKGLQSQLMTDFGQMPGVVDMRGRGNYPCRLHTKVNCDMGLCMFGVKCIMKDEGGCAYFDQLNRAKHAKVVITNYSYWMSQNEYSDGLGRFDMLVLDEAHSAPDHILDHVNITFNKKSWINKSLDLDDSLPNDYMSWRNWAEDRLAEANLGLETAKVHRKEKQYIQLKRLVDKLSRLTEVDKTWVWEDTPMSVTLSPTWPAPFAETILFLGIPKVVLTSATAVRKTADLLGIKNHQLKAEEFPHSFPVQNRPLVHIPTVRMNYKITDMENRLWISKVDQIIRDRVGTKGIIHTISYARRDMILAGSKYSNHMITHSRGDTESVVRTFKRADPPCILVSPSMATGWDFPDDECRFQIIVKLPYPDMRGAIMKARSRGDNDYINYIVAQQLIQATGRGVRSRTDWCETYVIDNNVTWFLDRNDKLVVDWFKEAFSVRNTVPKPMTKGE